MVGKLFICLTILWALIEPFNALPETSYSNYPEDDRVNNNQNEPNPKNDKHIPADDYPIYWSHKNGKYSKNDKVIIVEPTITYSSRAEYQSNQPVSSNFKPSPPDSGFKPNTHFDESGTYYPYYVQASSSSYNRNGQNVNEVRRKDEQNRVLDPSDPAYQRFVPRNYENRDSTTHIEDKDNHQRKYYYQTTQTTDARPQPKQQHPIISSKSSVRFYYSNGTEVPTYYNSDNQQVMDLYPNQYVLQLAETTTSTTTTTSRPVTRKTPVNTTKSPIYWRSEVDCPPFTPCNTIVYQQATQCCQCYLVPNRCCSCNYTNNPGNKRNFNN